jgi:propanediol dehydratase small subunit
MQRKEVKMNDMPVFKSFLREQLENQKELEKAIDEKNFEKAKELISKMIDRTQKGIEDN